MNPRNAVPGMALAALCVALVAPAGAAPRNQRTGPSVELVDVRNGHWSETHVRKVLQAFAFGGHATDDQIAAWAEMKPATAVEQILNFDLVNPQLSPPEDGSADHAQSLAALQAFWSSTDASNPVRVDKNGQFATLNGSDTFSKGNLQRAWVQAISARGVNPFLHKVAFFLTNYHAASSTHTAGAPLIRQYYDDLLWELMAGSGFVDILGQAAVSAAVARGYGHDGNEMRSGEFRGKDDFAREFHQLFFGIQGETEDPDYHEGVTIEGTARALTGMKIDKEPLAYGGTRLEFVGPIVFTDHQDAVGRNIWNISRHHTDCVEILNDGGDGANICGATAEDKVLTLADAAGAHPESMADLPVRIVRFFADDSPSVDTQAALRAAWADTPDRDLLTFLRAYARSTAFHSEDTVKFLSAFDRNLNVYNQNTLSNEETFAMSWLPSSRMSAEGAVIFEPAHNVFGGQTGTEASDNPNVFKDAYPTNVNSPWFLRTHTKDWTDQSGAAQTWRKDWGAVAPPDEDGVHRVGAVADWLWQRFVADGGKNFDPLIRAQILAILATGRDFGYAVDPADAERIYSTAEVLGFSATTDAWAAQTWPELNSADDAVRTSANQRIGTAINVIVATPYVFALEGN